MKNASGATLLTTGIYGESGSSRTAAGSVALTAGNYTFEFRQVTNNATSATRAYALNYKKGASGSYNPITTGTSNCKYASTLTRYLYDIVAVSSTITDYTVRVVVGDSAMPEDNCKPYTNETTGATVYKPIGILQRYGERNGCISGSSPGRT